MNNFDKLQAFVNGEGGNFAEACCGQNSFLWLAALGGLQGDKVPLVALLRGPDLLDGVSKSMPDATLANRVAGFAAVLEGNLTAAVEAFEAARHPGEEAQRLLVIADELKVSLENVVTPLPPLSTPGGWIVFDMLGHIQEKSRQPEPLACAEVPVLLDDGGNGQLAKFVVELLPGPDGLVTPDWWAMGLMHFPSTRISTSGISTSLDNFAESTQRLLRAIWKDKPNRLRWRLEPWKGGLTPTIVFGRSGEGAVAVAGRSVLLSQSAVESEREDAGLNSQIGITATVTESDQPMKDWRLGPVANTSIPNKFHAAAAGGLTEVQVATGQGPTPRPTTVRSHEVATLGGAYFEMQLSNEYIRAIQTKARTEYDDEWYPEITP